MRGRGAGEGSIELPRNGFLHGGRPVGVLVRSSNETLYRYTVPFQRTIAHSCAKLYTLCLIENTKFNDSQRSVLLTPNNVKVSYSRRRDNRFRLARLK